MFDMNKMMEKVKEVQEKMKEAQEKLEDITATAEAGAGMVKATVNGKKEVIDIEIDNDIIKPEDKEIIQDLVVAAINKALTEVDAKAKEEMKKSTQGFMPNIPGFDFGNMA
ncbi:YbaB/EbfC family nucleoid-associated protein [Catalinimonas sp. 4WD22]|uniref:YbaB/EbfC family nucleoid-associated protein n=1 Tax=Catalinimonas locisalis TaxID=3133978 RepID=UPI003100DAF5